MSAEELLEWRIFDRIQPITNAHRDRINNAFANYYAAAPHVRRRVKVEDFLSDPWRVRRVEQTDEEIEAVFRNISAVAARRTAVAERQAARWQPSSAS